MVKSNWFTSEDKAGKREREEEEEEEEGVGAGVRRYITIRTIILAAGF
jgi:hypothetical protein